ncbi:MAG: hypothetical protein OXC01_22120 [Immundisolibacterales bacterium]|nr:hypothetical protein [Immundisolibacterales bacterium]
MAEPRRESPLGRSPAATPNRLIEWPRLRVEELPFRAILVLHGRTGVPRFAQGVARVLGLPPPDAPNTFIESRFGPEAVVIAWAGPEEWLVIGQEEGTSGLRVALRQAIPEADGAVVDASSGFTLFSLLGPQARDLIAAGCTIDVHPRVFGPRRCAHTLYAGTGVCILERDETPRFELLVRRSYADWLWRWMEASAELLAVE